MNAPTIQTHRAAMDVAADGMAEHRAGLRHPDEAPMATEDAAVGPWVVFETHEHRGRSDWIAVHQDTGEVRALHVPRSGWGSRTDLERLAAMGFPDRTGPIHDSAEIARMWADWTGEDAA